MSMIVTGGATDVTSYIQMRLLTGGDATGLTIADFDMSYTRTRETPAAKVDATALAAANTAHTDNFGIEVDATNAPGRYRFDWPDAAFAAGVKEVILTIKHTSCFTESLRVEIDPFVAPAGANLSADLAAVKSDTAAILVDTGTTLDGRIPAALTAGGNMKSDALAISGSTESADRLERTTLAIVTGTCAALGTTTSVIASALSPTSAVNDQFNGRIITFDKDTATTALRGQATDITDYVHATLTFTVTALTTAPALNDTFTVT